MAKLFKDYLKAGEIRKQIQLYGYNEKLVTMLNESRKKRMLDYQKAEENGYLIDQGDYYITAKEEDLYHLYAEAILERIRVMGKKEWLQEVFEKYNKKLLHLFCSEERFLLLINDIPSANFFEYYNKSLLMGMFYLARNDRDVEADMVRLVGRYYKNIYRSIKKYDRDEFLDVFLINGIWETTSFSEDVICYYLMSYYFRNASLSLFDYVVFWLNENSGNKGIVPENKTNALYYDEIGQKIYKNFRDYIPSSHEYLKEQSDIFCINEMDYQRIKGLMGCIMTPEIEETHVTYKGIFLLFLMVLAYEKEMKLIWQEKIFDLLNEADHETKKQTVIISPMIDWEKKYNDLKNHYEENSKEQQKSQLSMERQMKKQEKEILELKEFLKKSENQKKELLELLEESPDEEMQEAKQLELFANRNILMIGGFPRWQRDLSKHCPGWKFVEGDNKGLHMNPDLYHAELIVFFTGYMSHSHFEKAVSICRNNKIPHIFVTSTNYQKMAESISEALRM